MDRRRRCPLIWLLAAAVLAGVASPAAAQRRVLILTAESPELPGGAMLREGIESALHAGGSEPVTVYEETIDTTRFPGSDYDANLAALYRTKYGTTPPSLVITLGTPALDFVRRHQALFVDVPLLFGFVDERAASVRPVNANATGAFVQVEASATVEAALALHPGTRHVVVVGGTSPFDRAWVDVTRQDLRALESTVSFTYWTDVPFQTLLADVAGLREGTIVLYVTMTRDRDGHPRVPQDIAALLRQTAKVPVYGMASSFLGRGIVGGVLLDLRRHGADLGRRARQILDGDRAAGLALVKTANTVAFDWNELRRFGIDAARLPPGATVVNREPGIWGLYKRTILAVTAALIGQSLLIGALLVQRRRRRRAELSLRDLSGRLLSAQEDERRRIARELHDNLSQQIASLAIAISHVAQRLGEPRDPLARSLRELGERTVEISTEIHNLSHRLHSSKLEMLGLVDAIRGHCHELREQGIRASVHEENMPRSLPPDVELGLFRIVQEALNNVAKHSGAHEAQVALRMTGEVLVLTVVDAGRGFDEKRAARPDGLGLASMRERLRLLGGEFTVSSLPGRGTTIVARVPLPKTVAKTAGDSIQVA